VQPFFFFFLDTWVLGLIYLCILINRHSAGFVYLRFENTQGAVAAQRALHGRWFAGKMITATYMVIMFSMASFCFIFFNTYCIIKKLKIKFTCMQVPQAYETKFPESR
jgi:hypothetical protein